MDHAKVWDWAEIAPNVDNASLVGREIAAGGVTTRLVRIGRTYQDPDHQHTFDQWLHVMGGGATVVCDGKPFTLRVGSILRIPANMVHSATFQADSTILLIGVEDGR